MTLGPIASVPKEKEKEKEKKKETNTYEDVLAPRTAHTTPCITPNTAHRTPHTTEYTGQNTQYRIQIQGRLRSLLFSSSHGHVEQHHSKQSINT